MRAVLGWLLALALLAGLGFVIHAAAGAPPPDLQEIEALFGDAMPAPETADPPELTPRRTLRGWLVWMGNYPRYHREEPHQIDRRHDPEDRERDIRTYRTAESLGARVCDAWLTITGRGA